jgi:hypothetical protein
MCLCGVQRELQLTVLCSGWIACSRNRSEMCRNFKIKSDSDNETGFHHQMTNEMDDFPLSEPRLSLTNIEDILLELKFIKQPISDLEM